MLTSEICRWGLNDGVNIKKSASLVISENFIDRKVIVLIFLSRKMLPEWVCVQVLVLCDALVSLFFPSLVPHFWPTDGAGPVTSQSCF